MLTNGNEHNILFKIYQPLLTTASPSNDTLHAGKLMHNEC